MKPTKAWVEKTVRTWQKRLGLVEWTIVVDWDRPALEGALATVWKSNDYLHATILLGEGFEERDREAVEQTLVHELLHVHLRDLSRAHDYAFEALGRQARKVAGAAWDHAEEALVDRLADSLVKAWPR